MKFCPKPPAGWICTRAQGHDGPCAAYRRIDVEESQLPAGPLTNRQFAILMGWVIAAVLLAFALGLRLHAQERVSPADAAAVLRACECPFTNVARMPAPLPEGPTWVSTGAQPGALGWLSFPAFSPRTHLDGTPGWWPQTLQFRYPMLRFEPLLRSEGVSKGGLMRQESEHLPLARRSQ